MDNVETRGATGGVVLLEKEKMRGITAFCGEDVGCVRERLIDLGVVI